METIRLRSIKEITHLPSYQSRVLLKRLYKNEEALSKSGILLTSDPSFRPHWHADRISTVVMLPDSLHFKSGQYRPGEVESMPWETNIELEIGDVVWHTFMEVDTMIDILVDDEPDELYKLIRYDDIYLAKRGDELIPLNGYCLCEEIKKEQSSNIEVISVVDDMTANPHGVDMTRGKIAYIGRPNKKYRIGLTEADLDGEDIIEVGDIIIKRRSDHHIRLEEDIHNKLDKMYFIIQRKDMYAKYEKSNSNNS